jgi:hypothetical protein
MLCHSCYEAWWPTAEAGKESTHPADSISTRPTSPAAAQSETQRSK